MTLDTNMLIAYYCAIAAAYNVVLQGFDFHTTSESLKRKIAREANENLDMLNADGPHAGKFWKLAWIKVGCAALCALIGAVGWFYPEYAVASSVILTVLGLFYTKIILSNWKIYKGA